MFKNALKPRVVRVEGRRKRGRRYAQTISVGHILADPGAYGKEEILKHLRQFLFYWLFF